MLSLLLAVSENRLYECACHHDGIVGACSEAVFSNVRSEILELWAIELLGRVGAGRALAKLQIHYTYELRAAAPADADRLELCLLLVCSVLARLPPAPLHSPPAPLHLPPA